MARIYVIFFATIILLKWTRRLGIHAGVKCVELVCLCIEQTNAALYA